MTKSKRDFSDNRLEFKTLKKPWVSKAKAKARQRPKTKFGLWQKAKAGKPKLEKAKPVGSDGDWTRLYNAQLDLPLFFCVRATSRSISAIFSSIPMFWYLEYSFRHVCQI